MKYTNYWGVVLGLAVGTFLIRASFIYLSSRVTISNKLKDFFSLIPAAIFPALIVPMAFFHKGSNDFLYNKERFLVLIIAAFICYKFKSILLTIVSGLFILYILS